MHQNALTWLGLCCLLAACSTAPPTIRDEAFDDYQHTHKVVAIIPFNVAIMLKRIPDGVTMDDINQLELAEGLSFQEALYNRYLTNPQNFTVKVQAIEQTNKLLADAGIPQTAISTYTKYELADVLNVDAVISGWIERSQPITEGQAARDATFSALALPLTLLFPGAPTNSVGVTMNIHDGGTGKLVWLFAYTMNGRYGSSSAKMAEALADEIGEQFPYRIANTDKAGP